MQQRDIFPRSLQYLVAIAEYGSYTRAAEALHVSQPTLSQQIKQLEESLQSSLLDRTGRTVQLTDAGEIYLRHARRARGELDGGARAILDVQNLSRGSLRLGWTPITDHLTCSLLENYNYMYPGINLHTYDMPQDDIEISVAESKIDIGIVFTKPFAATARPNELEMDVLFEEKFCVAVGKKHSRSKQRERMTAKNLEQESLALLNTDFALRRHVDDYCNECEIEPRFAIESNSLSAIIYLIENRPLATILPLSIVIKEGLHPIMLSPEIQRKEITLIYRKDGYKSPASVAFSDLAHDWKNNKFSNKLKYDLHDND
ncbi:MAG: transcriptional regulator CynR [Gammaproteobacteria bacterium]